MTDREKAIVMAYTGVTMLSGEKFQIFHEYIEKILGRPVWTHELAIELVWNEIKEKSKDDFLEICKTEDKSDDRPTGHWINELSIDIGYKTAECSECGERSRLIAHDTGFGYEYEYYPFCHWCGADMRGEK